MSFKLFVGNLSFSLDDKELRQAFAESGVIIRAEIVRDRFNGRSRGFGFVEMENESEAGAALKALNGKELGGRPMRVEAATSRHSAERSAPSPGR